MNKTILLSFSLFFLLLSSCGDRDGRKARAGKKGSTPDVREILPINNGGLDEEELILAKVLCRELEIKSLNYTKDYTEDYFHFRIENKKCSQISVTDLPLKSQIETADNESKDLIYKSEFESRYFRLIQTHEQGDFEEVCTLLRESQIPKKQSINGDFLTELYFTRISGNKIRAIIKRAKKRESTSAYNLVLTRQYEFLTTGILTGLEQSIIEKEVCVGGQEMSYLKSTFISKEKE